MEHIENFLPMRYEKRPNANGTLRVVQEPAIRNLILMRSEEDSLSHLKEKYPEEMRHVDYRRYVTDDFKGTPIIIRDKDMNIFMNAVKPNEDKVTYFDLKELKEKNYRHVIVIDGPFKGVEGELVRLGGNRHIVVKIPGVIGASLVHIPISKLRFTKE